MIGKSVILIDPTASVIYNMFLEISHAKKVIILDLEDGVLPADATTMSSERG